MDNNDLISRKLATLNRWNTETKKGSLVEALDQKIKSMGAYAQEMERTAELNKNSLVTRLGVEPDSLAGSAVNLFASLGTGGARLAGHVAALPAQIGATSDAWDLGDREYQAYDRYKQGKASAEDMNLLNSRATKGTFRDRQGNQVAYESLPNMPTVMESIVSSQNKRELARDIVKRADTSNTIHQGNRQQLDRDLGDAFEQPWQQVSKGWESLKNYDEGAGWKDIASGMAKLLVNTGSAVGNNKMAALEYITENLPQVGVGALGVAGKAGMAASNIGYAFDAYNQGIEEFQKKNKGAMPSDEQRQEMGMYAASLALAEQVGDVSMLKGLTGGSALKESAAGFKKTLANAAKEMAKEGFTEAATEGWQTHAEGKAGLKEASAEDIYKGSVIGGLAGAGMAAGGATPAIAASGLEAMA